MSNILVILEVTFRREGSFCSVSGYKFSLTHSAGQELKTRRTAVVISQHTRPPTPLRGTPPLGGPGLQAGGALLRDATGGGQDKSVGGRRVRAAAESAGQSAGNAGPWCPAWWGSAAGGGRGDGLAFPSD